MNVLRDMHIMCLPIDQGVFVAVLLACEQTKDLDTAVKACKLMEKHNINFTTAVFKQLLKVCSATNKIGRSMYIFQNIREREKDNLKGDFGYVILNFISKFYV
eukprot:UN13216